MRIRAFLNYMVEFEVVNKNPARKVKRQKEDVKIDVFTDEQIRQMLSFYRRIKRREKKQRLLDDLVDLRYWYKAWGNYQS